MVGPTDCPSLSAGCLRYIFLRSYELPLTGLGCLPLKSSLSLSGSPRSEWAKLDSIFWPGELEMEVYKVLGNWSQITKPPREIFGSCLICVLLVLNLFLIGLLLRYANFFLDFSKLLRNSLLLLRMRRAELFDAPS